MNNEKIELCAIMSDEISVKSGAHLASVLGLRLVRTETEKTCVHDVIDLGMSQAKSRQP
jgi:hypothetical protein